jgi:hypothetical protein
VGRLGLTGFEPFAALRVFLLLINVPNAANTIFSLSIAASFHLSGSIQLNFPVAEAGVLAKVDESAAQNGAFIFRKKKLFPGLDDNTEATQIKLHRGQPLSSPLIKSNQLICKEVREKNYWLKEVIVYSPLKLWCQEKTENACIIGRNLKCESMHGCSEH